jgi:hypothetical protein
MGTDGACGLLFCASKRSGAFPPNMPAGLRARVYKEEGRIEIQVVSPTHKRTEGRAPVWGSEFTSKRRRTTGGVQQKLLLG